MPEITVKSEPVAEGNIIQRDDAVDPGMLQFFNLSENDLSKSEKYKMREIKDYIISQSKDEFESWQLLRDIKYRLGTPQLGISYIDHIHKYIKLRNAVAQSEEQLKDMER